MQKTYDALPSGQSAPLKTAEIFFPLQRQEVFLFVVAFLAGGYDVAFRGCAAADERNDVVHGEFRRMGFRVTVIADTTCELLLPPGALPQLTSLAALPLDILGGACGNKGLYLRPLLFSSSS